MSRLQMDNLIGTTRPEPGRSTRNPLDRAAPQSDAFDEHLRRARTTASRDDSSRSESTDRAAAEGPSKPQRDANATARDDEPKPGAAPAETTGEDRAEKASKTSDEPSDGAAAEQEVREKDHDEGGETAETEAAAVVNVAAEAVAQPAVEEAALKVTAETEPAVGEKNDEAAVTKDGAGMSPDSAPPAVSDENAGEPPDRSGETDAVAPAVEAEPRVGTSTQEPPATNTNTPSPANQQRTAAPTDKKAASSRPADAVVAEKHPKDDRHAADDVAEAGETVPAQVASTRTPKGDTAQAAGVAEEKVAAKTTETDVAEPVAKPVLPAGHHDPAGSTRPGSGGPSPSGTATGDGANAADRAQFLERVAGAFRSASQGDGTVRMRLHPPELGSLRLEVSVRNGALTARLQTDTPEARSVLLDHLPALRDRLAQQDIKIERFEVSYQNGSGGSPTGTEDQAASRDGSGRHAPRGAGAEPETPRPPRSARVPQPGAGLQLDVTV